MNLTRWTFNSIRLSESEDIFDLELFIDSHLRSIKKNYANPTFAADVIRLRRLKEKLESMQPLYSIIIKRIRHKIYFRV